MHRERDRVCMSIHIYIYIYRERERGEYLSLYISLSLSLYIYIYIYICFSAPTPPAGLQQLGVHVAVHGLHDLGGAGASLVSRAYAYVMCAHMYYIIMVRFNVYYNQIYTMYIYIYIYICVYTHYKQRLSRGFWALPALRARFACAPRSRSRRLQCNARPGRARWGAWPSCHAPFCLTVGFRNSNRPSRPLGEKTSGGHVKTRFRDLNV